MVSILVPLTIKITNIRLLKKVLEGRTSGGRPNAHSFTHSTTKLTRNYYIYSKN